MPPGHVLQGRYKVLRKIGDGAMSDVYLAVDMRKPDSQYAIKVLKDGLARQANLGQRFRDEQRILERLQHPGIVAAHAYFEDEGMACIVLSFIDGQSLADVLRRGSPMQPAEALPIFAAVLSALDHAHRAGVIHRDIKPSNILIDRQGRPHLCDFGIARQVGARGATAFGTTLGTPQYMSPEQITSPRTIDHRSDLYSAGILLYEMLTGQVPFGDGPTESDFEVFDQQVKLPPPDPRTINSSLDEAYCEVLRKALRKNPDRRYQGGSEFADALTRARTEAGTIRPVRRASADSSEPDPRPAQLPAAVAGEGLKYRIYRRKGSSDAAVKIGINWPALFLGEIWMCAESLYLRALCWFVGTVLIVFLAVATDDLTGGVGTALAWLLWLAVVATRALAAWLGNAWREQRLQDSGYRLLGEVRAKSERLAVARARELLPGHAHSQY